MIQRDSSTQNVATLYWAAFTAPTALHTCGPFMQWAISKCPFVIPQCPVMRAGQLSVLIFGSSRVLQGSRLTQLAITPMISLALTPIG